MNNTTWAIIGTLISFLLGINAFFIKSLVSEMTGMRVDLTKVITQHENTIEDVKELKADIADALKEVAKVKERLHSLEGGQSQVLVYLKELDR